jgi:putative ABC transport system permease protein
MRLALTELRRRPGRFVTATVVLTLIAVLLLFLGGLLDGLTRNATGALRAQEGDAVVFSADAERSYLRSRIEADLRSRVEAVPGVEQVGGLGVVQLGARVPGAGVRDLADVALFGYEVAPRGVGDAPGPGQAWADEALRADGVEVGTVLELGPARSPVEVVGFVEDISYAGQASLWATPATWREVQNANRPDAAVGDDVVQALLVRVDPGAEVEPVLAAIDDASDGATESIDLTAAADALGGVEQQRSVFNQILGITVVIAVLVVALFFALLTVERTSLYGVLKAIGARSRTLAAGVLAQAVVVTLLASAVGVAVAMALDAAIPPGSVPFELSGSRILTSVVALLVAATVGSAFSLRRVLRVDPASAIGS